MQPKFVFFWRTFFNWCQIVRARAYTSMSNFILNFPFICFSLFFVLLLARSSFKNVYWLILAIYLFSNKKISNLFLYKNTRLWYCMCLNRFLKAKMLNK